MTDEAQESLRVMLAEMRGDLKTVLSQMNDLLPRVCQHDKDITDLRLTTQRLQIEADARKAAIKDAADAVRAVKLADHESDLAEAARAERIVIPWSRIFGWATVFVTVALVVVTYLVANAR